MAEPDVCILEYEHENSRPREAEALQLLKTVGSLVKPIMKRRGWKIGVLSECFHSNRQLLGLNCDSGQKIFLCLRDFNNEQEFRPLEHIVDTMLHEFGHMVHRDHTPDFWVLRNRLVQDFSDLLDAGYQFEEPPPS